MVIKPYDSSDDLMIRDIHQKYYRDQFPVPMFNNGINVITIMDNDSLVLTGGLIPMIEAVAISNPEISIRKRIEALRILHQMNMFSANELGMNQIHIQVHDEKWLEILKKKGYQICKGTMMVLNAGNE